MTQNNLPDLDIEAIVEKDVLELIGGANLPEEKKQELYATISKTVQNRAIAHIYDKLTKDEGVELDRLMDEGDFVKVQEYLRTKGLEYTAILTQEAMSYKVEIYELFKLANQPASGQASDINNQL